MLPTQKTSLVDKLCRLLYHLVSRTFIKFITPLILTKTLQVHASKLQRKIKLTGHFDFGVREHT